MYASPLKINWRFGGKRHLHLQGQTKSHTINQCESRWEAVLCLAYSLILKMEVTFSSKTSLDFQRSTQLYIPEDKTLLHS
jgi:hypothetical protein